MNSYFFGSARWTPWDTAVLVVWALGALAAFLVGMGP